MSIENTEQANRSLDRRTILKSMGVAGVAGAVGLGTGSVAAETNRPKVAAADAPETPHVRGSTDQVLVIGATEDAILELRDSDDQPVETATADEFGSYAFRNVDSDETYSVVEDPDGDEVTLADEVSVFARDYVPPQELYDNQTLTETPEGEIDYIEMRDGTKLACQVRLPPVGSEPYGTLILYDGYAPSVGGGLFDEVGLFGYAVVAVNKRGSQCSGGKFDLWEYLQWLDGYDIVETVAAQEWCDGVGLVGASYSGYSQFYAAAPQPPSLDAIAPGVPVGDFYRDVGWPGGILNNRFATGWAEERDVQNAPFAEDSRGDVDERVDDDELCYFNQLLRGQNAPTRARLEETPYDEEFFQERAAWNFVDDIEVPTLLMTSWQDEQVGSRTTRLLERFEGHPVHFIGINGDHGAMEAFIPDILDFFTFYLDKEVPRDFDGSYEDALAEYQATPYRIYWEKDQDKQTRFSTDYADWPPGETWRLYFQPDGSLGDTPPETDDASSSYEFVSPDSDDQQLSRENGRLVWEPDPAAEHISFVTDPFPTDHTLVGSGLVELWLASTADNTDVQVDLIEVRPDGQETYVQSGWLRASQRAEDDSQALPRRPWHTHKPEDEEPLGDGFERLRVEFHPFAHIFRRGSRLKVAVTNPGGVRDLWAFDVLDEEATNEVAHTAEMPSKVELPLVSGERAALRTRPECGDLRNQPCRESPDGALELPEVAGVVPEDIDGDGLYEDLTGDGTVTVADVQTLFENLHTPEIQDNAWAYNFSESSPARVTVFDVQALFTRASDI